MSKGHFKDQIIAELSKTVNVAQFVSYSPDLKQRFSCVSGYELNHQFSSVEEVVKILFDKGQDQEVTIRTFDPSDPKSRPFLKGIGNMVEAAKKVRELAQQGLHTIIHEEIIDDLNLSGVIVGDVIEFAPLTTPRCVEPAEIAKHGIPASLPRELGIKLLEKIFGIKINLDYPRTTRVEFSLFVKKYGHKQDHVMIWELEEVGQATTLPLWDWPNRFSKYIGDKTYGLLIAELIGLKVPKTKVVSKNKLLHFNFGQQTDSQIIWTRTAPMDMTPGKYPTERKYIDHSEILSKHDPDGTKIATILYQDEVPFNYSGSLMYSNGHLQIEGVKGRGDQFMVGSQAPEQLPEEVKQKITQTYQHAEKLIGPVRMEWVYDGTDAWVVQMHRGQVSNSSSNIIVDGSPSSYERFVLEPNNLESFRNRVELAKQQGIGLEVVGNFGITSHIGDILRKAQVPSKIIRPS